MKIKRSKIGYRYFLGRFDIWCALLFSTAGRLPFYLINLSIVLIVQEHGGTAAASGMALASYATGTGLVGPFIARRVDIFGQCAVLRFSASLQLIAFALLLWPPIPFSSAAPLFCFFAGAFLPPITISMRQIWISLSPAEVERRVAFSIEAVLAEVFTIGGPLLLSILLALSDPRGALIGGALMSFVGAWGLSFTSVCVQASQPLNSDPSHSGSTFEPLRFKGFRSLFLRRSLAACSMGAYFVVLPMVSLDSDQGSLVGVYFAALGLGSVVGGIIFGAIDWQERTEILYARSLLVAAATSFLPVFATTDRQMIAALFVSGFALAPAAAAEFVLIERVTPDRYRARGISLMITSFVAGTATGAQIGGILVDFVGVFGTFLMTAAMSLVSALFAFRLLEVWRESAIESSNRAGRPGSKHGADGVNPGSSC
ncbi:MFS transporter [Streptomyces sp. NPDC048411]|uniref:MFS transporter n=1 Tax=Streptomyces sp. NPDC048411 TaxID=3157206 RepID=UPI00345120EB